MPITDRTRLTDDAGIDFPIICGAMYPCTNPELVAAASAAGAIGIVQPVSMTFVYGHDFREGLRLIKRTTDRPFGMNALIEKSSRSYHERLVRWMDIALEEGVRFFITSLGNPRWVVDRAAQVGGIVYHDVTNRIWAEKAAQNGVRGLIAVNSEAGGHPGKLGPQALLEEVSPLGLPVVCAGGVGDAHAFRAMMDLGYDGVQLGTRFIASAECRAHPDYKQAIVSAEAKDIVLTERLTGLPVAVLNNEYIQRLGLRAGPVARFMLQHRKMKYWMRAIYAATSHRRLKESSLTSSGAREYWQAGKSVGSIGDIRPVREIVEELASALR